MLSGWHRRSDVSLAAFVRSVLSVTVCLRDLQSRFGSWTNVASKMCLVLPNSWALALSANIYASLLVVFSSWNESDDRRSRVQCFIAFSTPGIWVRIAPKLVLTKATYEFQCLLRCLKRTLTKYVPLCTWKLKTRAWKLEFFICWQTSWVYRVQNRARVGRLERRLSHAHQIHPWFLESCTGWPSLPFLVVGRNHTGLLRVKHRFLIDRPLIMSLCPPNGRSNWLRDIL